MGTACTSSAPEFEHDVASRSRELFRSSFLEDQLPLDARPIRSLRIMKFRAFLLLPAAIEIMIGIRVQDKPFTRMLDASSDRFKLSDLM